MNAEVIELNDDESPGASQKLELVAVPRIGELIAFGERYFDVVNVIHRLEDQSVSVNVWRTKKPYEKRKSGFGFGGR